MRTSNQFEVSTLSGFGFIVLSCQQDVAFLHLNCCRDRETGEVAAAKYLRQEKSKVRREAAILRTLIQSAFVVRLVGLYESNLNSVLVTEYLAGGDLVTR